MIEQPVGCFDSFLGAGRRLPELHPFCGGHSKPR
jgi:hypothetical protein